MEKGRGGRDDLYNSSDSFPRSSGFGSLRPFGSMIPSLFGGRDPFDDPFFSHPFRSSFGHNTFGRPAPSPEVHPSESLNEAAQTYKAVGPIIEELSSDDEGEGEGQGQGDGNRQADKENSPHRSSKEPFVEHVDEGADVERKANHVNYRNDNNKAEGTKPQTRSFSFQSVKYGGINGAYYTASTTRRTGEDGVMMEERREADMTTGQAAHRISRGIHDKGHSLTRNLTSEGKVNTMQTLHNLNEDELAGFERSWKDSVDSYLTGWSGGFNFQGNAGGTSRRNNGQPTQGGWAPPSIGWSQMARGDEPRSNSSTGRAKKVVTINIE